MGSRARCQRRRTLRLGPTVIAIAVLLAAVALPVGAIPRSDVQRVSGSTAGVLGNDWSEAAGVSDDGRYVVFSSAADNLVANDTNGAYDVFLRDTEAGTTERISVDPNGDEVTSASGGSYAYDVSADCNRIVFESDSPDHVADDTNGLWDVFVRDLGTGTTVRASVDSSGTEVTSGDSSYPAISADGRFVVFDSSAESLVPDDDNGNRDVFVYDTVAATTTRVSVHSNGNQGSGDSRHPEISRDGRFVVFESSAPDLIDFDSNGKIDIFVHDLKTGTTEIASVAYNGVAGDDHSRDPGGPPAVSNDGRYVAFQSYATNLVPNDTNGTPDIFVRDRWAGKTTRVSVTSSGGQHEGTFGAFRVSMDALGRDVVYQADGALVTEDANGVSDLYRHDVWTGVTTLVSSAHSGDSAANGVSLFPKSTRDGAHVAFSSVATDLVMAPDDNDARDAFVRNVLPESAVSVEVAGADRYETAVEASKRAFPNGAQMVIIATGLNWPDALGGSALAGVVEGPLLLTDPGKLPAAVKSELGRLGAKNAIILGGATAVSGGVFDELDDILEGGVARLSGADRYGTARAVADEVIRRQFGRYSGAALVATGADFPDALAGSPIAAAYGQPILLASPKGAVYLPDETDSATVLGGEVAVPAAVEIALKADLGAENVSRLSGSDRYGTAAAVAEHGVEMGLKWNGVSIATGQMFPDALAGGSAGGQMGSVVLLTGTASLPAAPRGMLETNKDRIAKVHFIGGTVAVSDDVRTAVLNAIK
jgi:putative cell wall-binding protein/Tol biopolymer transport system component